MLDLEGRIALVTGAGLEQQRLERLRLREQELLPQMSMLRSNWPTRSMELVWRWMSPMKRHVKRPGFSGGGFNWVMPLTGPHRVVRVVC